MNLVSLECQEKIIEALLKLYDNCCVCHSLKTNNVPMHVQLTILFNIQWLALTTKGFSSDDQVLWDRLFSRIVDFCHRGKEKILPLKFNSFNSFRSQFNY